MGDFAPESLPLIQTKLHRPPVPIELVPRLCLTEWLDQGRGRPLTLVSVPAGYGKSTLISSWLESLDWPTAWVTLDEHNDDQVMFLSYFLASIRGAYTMAVGNMQTLLNAPDVPLVRVLASSLVNEMSEIWQQGSMWAGER